MSQRPTTDDLYRGDGLPTDKSAGQLMKEVTEDLSTLVRKEIELAKREVSDSVAAKAKGALVIAVAGFIAFFALIFVLLAIRDGLDEVMPAWAADLVTAVILLAIAGGAAMAAKKKLATPIRTELTKQNIKEDVALVKSLGRR